MSALVASATTGCGPGEPDLIPSAPLVISEHVELNPNNVISATFWLQASGATRARIEILGDRSGSRFTPTFPINDDAITVPLLGLMPETDYLFRPIVASRSGVVTVGEWCFLRSGSLPDSIVAFEVDTDGSSERGLTLITPYRTAPGLAPHPAVIIDADGRVVWYREESAGIIDFQLQPNGHLTAAVALPAVSPFFAGIYKEWDGLGNEVGRWQAQGHEFTDQHELRLVGDGDEGLLFGFEHRAADLSRFGGPPEGNVIGSVLQRVKRDGTVVFEWSSLDHYSLDDADDFVWRTPGEAGYDFTHANAIEVLPDGDYLVSTRHLSEITRVDGTTGAIRWRMGNGKGNEFRFLDDPKGGFSNMHAVRRLPNGHLLFIDNGNGHTPPSSRAVEYELDEASRTATLVWSYEPGTFNCCMGFAQRLPNGNTLVNFGNHRVLEISPAGAVVWKARLPNEGAGFLGIYRATRISSLDDLR